MTDSEIVILPEDIYKLFIISDPPENFADFDAFGFAECQEPIGPNKPEGIPDWPPYAPKKQRLPNDNSQQQPNHNRQQQHKFNFQRGGKFKQQQQHQQQQQQKKIVSTVEISPEFANKDLGTWAKKSPALSPTSSSPATNGKLPPNFNPEKAPSASPFSSASFNPQLLSSSSNKSSSNSSAALFQPQPVQSQQTQQPTQQPQPSQPQTVQQHPLQPRTVQQQPKTVPQKSEAPAQMPSSGWGNFSKPKTQSFAELLKNEQLTKPTENRPAPAFKPETISHPQAETTVILNDDKDFPSFASISKPKKSSPWDNFKP